MDIIGKIFGAMVIEAGVFVVIYVLSMMCSAMSLYIQASTSHVNVNLIELAFMKLRGVSPEYIVAALIKAHNSRNAELSQITMDNLETHYLAGGNVGAVVDAVIQAMKARIPLTYQNACAIDLAGRDVLDAVNMCVNPKVIKTPLIAAVAKDGIQVKAMARVTVKADINRLVGGAGEATVIARVGEGICTTIGSAESHKEVLASPKLIADKVIAQQLDSGTAFNIMSIDIADIDVGKNIGSELQIQQANADKNIAQAKSEQRRAMAIAEEQEMKAKVVEMQAKVIASEAEVPLALAASLRAGIKTA